MGQQKQSINAGYLLNEQRNTNSGNTLGGTPTGTTDTAVLGFVNTAAALNSGVSPSTQAASGTIVSISQPGIYFIKLALDWTGAVAIQAGIGINMAASPIVANPVLGTDGVRASTDVLGVASFTGHIELTWVEYIDQADADLPTTVRFLATNSAGAAPVGLVAAFGSFSITQIAPLQV